MRSGQHARRGVGVAGMFYGCGNTSLPNPSTIRFGLKPDGRLSLHQGAVDIGQGSNTVITQIAADAVGLPLAADRPRLARHGPDARLRQDLRLAPDLRHRQGGGARGAGARAACCCGSPMRARARRLELGGGKLRVTETASSARSTSHHLPRDAHGYVLCAEETFDPPTSPLDENGQGKPYAVYGYGAHLAEVEVDMRLGTVKVTRIVAAHDVGRAINPILVEGQIEGGVAQGIGMALMEEFTPGRGENLHDYLIPTIGDVPPIESILVECASSAGPFGAKGIGEQALIPTAPAILNAIHHATGARITRTPATPDRVLAAIRALHPP